MKWLLTRCKVCQFYCESRRNQIVGQLRADLVGPRRARLELRPSTIKQPRHRGMGLITYPRLNLRCEEHRKGRKAAYTSYFIISVSDLSFRQAPAFIPNYQNVLLNNEGSAEESVSY